MDFDRNESVLELGVDDCVSVLICFELCDEVCVLRVVFGGPLLCLGALEFEC